MDKATVNGTTDPLVNEAERPSEQAFPEYMDSVQTAGYLGCTVRHVSRLRRFAGLPAVKMGKGYVYSRSSCDQFMRIWEGFDLSSEENILSSVAIKQARERRSGR